MTLTDTTTGAISTLSGSWSLAPSPNAGITVPQNLLTLTAQGQTLLFGLATVSSPDLIIFGVGSSAIGDPATQIFFVAGF
jgi:hypothetical protein